MFHRHHHRIDAPYAARFLLAHSASGSSAVAEERTAAMAFRLSPAEELPRPADRLLQLRLEVGVDNPAGDLRAEAASQ